MSTHSHPTTSEETKSEDSGLNTAISVAVALAGTFMALAGVKSGNLSQAMQTAQSKQINAWSYFQAKSTKQNLAEGTLEQLQSLKELTPSASSEAKQDLDKKIAVFKAKVEKYETEKAEIKKEAEGWQTSYEDLNKVDDQFDLSDAAMSLGIALSGVSALTKRRSLFAVAVVFLAFGALMGLAGFMGWGLEVPFLSKLLS
jgi:hypothetical protein